MPIKYRSTRGKQNGLSFEQVVLGGLATDKGLFVPESIPTMSMTEIEQLRGMSYSDMAFEVISKFVGPEDVARDSLKDIVDRSFATFRHKDVTPCFRTKDMWMLELFHGPTFAFKDVALQFLGNLFEYFLLRGKIQSRITILGATSGDTGSAAIHGLRGKKNVNCFITYPKGKVTEIQERQLTTIPDDNVSCINIEGNFDDCQAIVKAAFADPAFREEVNLGAINSINWARVLAQITYYFYAWLKVTDKGDKKAAVNFAVPTGNFGDILAGYFAKRMGLPVDKLVVCTNQNDVLHRFLQDGKMTRIPAQMTIAPSMDISVSSNFERYLFYLGGENAETLASWMDAFESTGKMEVPKKLLTIARSEFLSYASDEKLIVKTMTEMWNDENYLLCPHTATAVAGIKALKLPADTSICLATAHPAKFEEAVNIALKNSTVPARPSQLEVLFSLPIRSYALPNSLSSVQGFVRKKLGMKGWMSTMVPILITVAAIAAIGFMAVSSNPKKFR